MVPDINLLPRRERKTTKNQWILYAFIFIFCSAIVFFVYRSVSLSNDIAGLEENQKVLEIEKESLLSEIEEAELHEEADLGTTVQFVESIAYEVSPIMIEVNRGLNENAYLREYEFTETSLNLKVDFETMREVTSYVDFLSESKYFPDVFVNQITLFELGNEDEDKYFNRVDRYSNLFELPIELHYLRAGETD